MSISAETTQHITDHLTSALPSIKLVYVFGSQAERTAAASSDWDIALLPVEPIDSKQRWDLAQDLANTIGRDVDLVDLSQASTVLQMQVVSKGQLLFGTRSETDVFETQVFSMYAHLQESRQNIIDEFVGNLKDG